MAREKRCEHLLVAVEEEFDLGVALARDGRAEKDGCRPGITAHRIYR
jgi:hypothetical protein